MGNKSSKQKQIRSAEYFIAELTARRILQYLPEHCIFTILRLLIYKRYQKSIYVTEEIWADKSYFEKIGHFSVFP